MRTGSTLTLVLLFSLFTVTLPAQGDAPDSSCSNPDSCIACHTEDDLADEDMGCDRGTWAPTGPLTSARDLASKTVLKDGRVLVTGGALLPDFTTVDTAEIFNPDTLDGG